MNVTTKQGTQGLLTIDTKGQKAVTTVNGVDKLVAFIRNNKVVIKNDMLLNESDMAYVKSQMAQFVKVVETGKKRK